MRSTRWMIAATIAIAAPASWTGGSVAGAQGTAGCDHQCGLDEARAATEHYWDASVAISEGFVELPGCESTPEGTGGITYVHPARASDQVVDGEQPETLLYVPDGLGVSRRVGAGRRLVGVEYSVPALEEGQEPPELFGQRFDGPVSDPMGSPRFRLRVWLFAVNPSGIFSPWNQAEACDAAGMVGPQAYGEHLHEVVGRFSLPKDHVRNVLRVPDEFELRGASGSAEVWIGSISGAWSIGSGPSQPALLAAAFAALLPPDRPGTTTSGEPLSEALGSFEARYPFAMVSDNAGLVDWIQDGMGVGPDVVEHNPDLVLEFAPVISRTGPEYRLTSPMYVLEATIGDAPPVDLSNTSRFWHETADGRMGLLRLWADAAQVGPALVDVTPTPGTPIAELFGCPSTETSCDPVSADFGIVITPGDRLPFTAETLDEWWNPRATHAQQVLACPGAGR